jgi:hypothetical protein
VIVRLAAIAFLLFATTTLAQQGINPKPLSEEERAAINAQRRAGCKAHADNLQMLQGPDRIMIEEGGKQRELTRAERDAQIAETKKILAEYCGQKKDDEA